MKKSLAERLNSILPQTQCQKCRYPSCIDYAKAIASKEANTNKCVPGGMATLQILNNIMENDNPPNLDLQRQVPQYHSVQIEESKCIGCKLCIPACPFDAIVGTKKYLHSVLTYECSGCELCITTCPVDCIEIINLTELKNQNNPSAKKLLSYNYADTSKKNKQRYLKTKRRREQSDRAKTKPIPNIKKAGTPGEMISSREKSLMIQEALSAAEEKLNRHRK